MKAIIFAGGVGTRLWPLSRKKTPKQFEKLIDNKSTLQIAIERLQPAIKPEDIFISTGEDYVEMVAKQIKEIPKENILGEPVRKDVGPAVAFVMGFMKSKFSSSEPVFISWSDHIVKDVDKFQKILITAGALIEKTTKKVIFIGQKPRFPSVNLGYIEYDKKPLTTNSGINIYKFNSFKYRPDKKTAEKYFKDGEHCWNLGYFVTTPEFMLDAFEKHSPELASINNKIISSLGKSNFKEELKRLYSEMPSVNFDNAVLEKLDTKDVNVIVEDIGWSDVGAWEALKEALETKKTDNITLGDTLLQDSTDNLVYNYDSDKLIVGIDLEDMLIVNSSDVLLVTQKKSVSKIKALVESFHGTKHEKLT
ncbi:MAG: sugar phosphate nucleotidyltransferase [bacterium]|nr:sugar phosphate nucleotidyltransferase [bacterium]